MGKEGTDRRASGVIGTAYLLHFDAPYKHAAHYRGWASDLPARLEAHRAGNGANLISVIQAAGIGWTLARVWEGVDRNYERALKRQGGAARMCPLCGVNPRKLV